MKKLCPELIREKIERDIQKLKAPEGYLWAGLPRFKRLFGRDSCVSGWQLLDIDPRIARHTLRALAKRQGTRIHRLREEEPGKILHECPVMFPDLLLVSLKKRFRWRFPYYGGIDSTAWFLILLGFYEKKTGDTALVRELWPNVLSALEWLDRYGDRDGDGLIEYERKNPAGLLHQGWKDGKGMNVLKIEPPVSLVEVQGYYYLALRQMAKISRNEMGDPGLANYLEQRAELLKTNFGNLFWMPEEQYFAFALDGKKQKVEMVTSNPGHLLFTGVLDKNRMNCVVERLFADDLWTPYGIRTLSTNDPLFDPRSYHRGSVWPHDNWIIYQGLLRNGYKKEAVMIRNALIRAVKTLTYIPELYCVENGILVPTRKACKIQAWACGTIAQLLTGKIV